MTNQDIDELFSYHRPMGIQTQLYEALREGAKQYALLIMDHAPPGPERTLAIRALHQASMHANSAIAVSGFGSDEFNKKPRPLTSDGYPWEQ